DLPAAAGTVAQPTAKERGYLASAVADGQRPQAREFSTGAALDSDCLLRGENGALLHKHCGRPAWPAELQLPSRIRQRAVDLPEVSCLLERALRPAPRDICAPPRSDNLPWFDDSDGALPSGELFLDGSAFEGEFTRCTSVGWAAVAPMAFMDINGGDLSALPAVLRHAAPPFTAVVDSKFVVLGFTQDGRERTRSNVYAWSHLRREVRRILDDLGGLGEGGLSARWVKAHCSCKRVREGVVSYRDWYGNTLADEAAKSAAAHARLSLADRLKLMQSERMVEGVAMWLSAVGAAVVGDDTTHRKGKANRPALRPAEAPPRAPALACQLRGAKSKRWCAACRWLERKSECPGSI
ncbi:unnamed protein product, partial [Prorocentrum cordatum]